MSVSAIRRSALFLDSWRLLFRTILLGVFCLFLGASPTHADGPPRPKLFGFVDGEGYAQLEVKLNRRTSLTGSRVTLERAESNLGNFAPIAQIEMLSRRAEIRAELPGGLKYAFRARFENSRGVSRWSQIVVLDGGAGRSDPLPPDYDTPATVPSNCPADYTSRVFDLVNATRRSAGRAPLAQNPLLTVAAQNRSHALVASQVLSHDGWSAAIRAAGYSGSVIGENIAYGYSTPEHVMNAWNASSGHYRNITSGSFRDIGIGCQIDQNGRYWWVQSFGG